MEYKIIRRENGTLSLVIDGRISIGGFSDDAKGRARIQLYLDSERMHQAHHGHF
jgi:hypothetical protein